MTMENNMDNDQKPLILIVDDTPKNLQVLVNILRKEDWKVAVATDGKKALSLVTEHIPDLILLDVLMPGMDGFEVCQMLKESPGVGDIPIIFLTAKTETQDIIKGFELGAVDYVAKPFNSLELLSRVRTHLDVKQSKEKILRMNEQLKKEIQERIIIADELKLKNAILDKMAVTDSLTGLFNHAHIIERLNQEVIKSRRYSFHLSIIMFDIDNFKNINDSYGHQIGDDVLIKISSTITHELRKVDLVGRYGGEEFLVILPHTNLKGCIITAERIRKSVEKMKWPEQGLTLTISGGICALESENVQDFIKKADDLLYKAKDSGRNRIIHEAEKD